MRCKTLTRHYTRDQLGTYDDGKSYDYECMACGATFSTDSLGRTVGMAVGAAIAGGFGVVVTGLGVFLAVSAILAEAPIGLLPAACSLLAGVFFLLLGVYAALRPARSTLAAIRNPRV